MKDLSAHGYDLTTVPLMGAYPATLRTYNEADVEATLRVRAWMRTSIHELPRAEALDR